MTQTDGLDDHHPAADVDRGAAAILAGGQMLCHGDLRIGTADVNRGTAAVNARDKVPTYVNRGRITDIDGGAAAVKANDKVSCDGNLRCGAADVDRGIHAASGGQVEAHLEQAAGHIEPSRDTDLIACQQRAGRDHGASGNRQRRSLHKDARRTIEAARTIVVGGCSRQTQRPGGHHKLASQHEQDVPFIRIEGR